MNEEVTLALEDGLANARINVEEKEYCKLSVSYIAEPDKVRQKRAEVIERVFKDSKKLVVPGFKRGRAPLNIVKIKFKKYIEDQTRREMESVAYDDVIFETKIKPIFYPQISDVSLHSNQFECKMVFLRKPTFELKQYKALELPKPHIGSTVAELTEKMLQDVRMGNGTTLPYKEHEFIQMGDKVTIDVKCMVGDEVIDRFTKPGHFYEVGSKFYPDFDENIQGMSIGEERSFDVLWDDTSKQRAKFTVKLHMGVKLEPAPLDDSLAVLVGCKDFAELRQRAEGAATQRLKKVEDNMLSQQIVNRLLDAHEIELPSWLVTMEAQSLAIQSGLKWADLDDPTRTNITELAKKQVKVSLIMDSIREIEPETQYSEKELISLLGMKAQEAGQDPNKFLVESQKSGKLFGMIASMQHQATLDWLVGQAKIVE